MFIEIVGWIGSVLIVGSYYLNIQGKLDSKDSKYIWSNLIGGFCFIINTYAHQAYPSVAVNIVWVLIALFAISERNKQKSHPKGGFCQTALYLFSMK